MTEDEKQEIARLAAARLDGSVDGVADARLREVLRGNPAAQAWYIEYCQLHSMLAWEHGGLPPVDLGDAESTTQSRSLRSAKRLARRWRSLAIAMSIMVLLTAGMFLYRVVEPGPRAGLSKEENAGRPRVPVGVLLGSNNPVWDAADFPARVGDTIFGSKLDLRSGSVHVAMFGGATVTLVAPCQVAFESDRRVFLRQGDILVTIHGENTKLVVETPVGELLHLGTEFGLSVAESGETEMYVFAGSVALKQETKGLPQGSARIFRDGTAARLQPSGRVEDLGREQYETFRLSRPPATADGGFKPRPLSIAKPGYRVRYMKSANIPLNGLSAAESLLAGRVAASEDTIVDGVPFVDFQDHPEADGKEYLNVFTPEAPFPGDRNGRVVNDDHFLIHATATLAVRDAWRYTFLVNVDDGARLRIDGKDVIVDDGIHPPQVSLGTVLLTPGEHTIELVAYDDSGFARVELGYAVGETRKLEQFALLRVGE